MSDKKRLPPTPSEPVAIKDWFEGKGTSQSVKLTDADRAMFLKLEELYPGHKVANFRDLVRLLGKAAFAERKPDNNDMFSAREIELETENSTLKTENERLSLLSQKLQYKLESSDTFLKDTEELLQNAMARERQFFGDDYRALKEATEKALATIMPAEATKGATVVPISHAEFIPLLVEYAQRDPSEQFPFPPACTPIINRLSHGATQNNTTNVAPQAEEGSGDNDTTAPAADGNGAEQLATTNA